MPFDNRIKKNYSFIHLFVSSKEQRKILIKYSTSEQINTIFEIILNIVSNQFKIPPSKIKELKPFNNLFIYLLNKNIPISKKRNRIGKNIDTIVEILKPFVHFWEKEYGKRNDFN